MINLVYNNRSHTDGTWMQYPRIVRTTKIACHSLSDHRYQITAGTRFLPASQVAQISLASCAEHPPRQAEGRGAGQQQSSSGSRAPSHPPLFSSVSHLPDRAVPRVYFQVDLHHTALLCQAMPCRTVPCYTMPVSTVTCHTIPGSTARTYCVKHASSCEYIRMEGKKMSTKNFSIRYWILVEVLLVEV